MTTPEDSDPPSSLLCRDVQTGFGGELKSDDNGIVLRLIRHDHRMFSGEVSDFFVELEDGDSATLLSCVPVTWGPHSLETRVNEALIGNRFWQPDDRVRLLMFTFWSGREALHYNDHVKYKNEPSHPDAHPFEQYVPSVDFTKLEILNATPCIGNIKVGLSASLKIDRFRPGPSFSPLVVIEFSSPQELGRAYRLARHVLTFFELSSGRKSRPLDVIVSTMTSAQRIAAQSSEEEPDDFKLRMPYGSWTTDSFRNIPCALFPVHDAAQRNAAEKCLQLWIDRLDDWEPSYALLSGYIATRARFDRDRLLRLASWFESIPLTDKRTDVTKAERQTIVQAAQESARMQGRSDLEGRVQELLSGLSKKPLKAQLESACAKLRIDFGAAVPIRIGADLTHFATIRNDAAHGRIALDGANAEQDIRAMRAAELVCLLSMLDGLPWSPSMIGSIAQHSLGTYSVFQYCTTVIPDARTARDPGPRGDTRRASRSLGPGSPFGRPE